MGDGGDQMSTPNENLKFEPAPAHPALAITLYVLAMASLLTGLAGGLSFGDTSTLAGWSFFAWWAGAALGLLVAGRVFTFLWRISGALERLSPPPAVLSSDLPAIDSTADPEPSGKA